MWKKLTLDNSVELRDAFVSTQADIRTGPLSCSFTDLRDNMLIPLLNGRKLLGEAWIYSDGGFYMIFGVKFVKHLLKWKIISTMSNEFSQKTAVGQMEIMADKILDFMASKDITEIFGDYLFIYDYDNTVYAQAGYTLKAFTALITAEYAKKGLSFIINDKDKRLEIRRTTSANRVLESVWR